MIFVFAWSQTTDGLSTEAHKQREKVRRGEHIDARRKYPT
jgi:hypothetical protein